MIAIEPQNGLVINNDVDFKPGNYVLPDGLSIDTNRITLDGNGAHIIGNNRGIGISINGKQGITVRNLKISNYYHGVFAHNSKFLDVNNCHITNTFETPANIEFLDIWRSTEHAYGAGIMLLKVSESRIYKNDLQHQMNGLLSYHSDRLLVEENIANYCSGWGFQLYETCNSTYINNFADFCCRYESRPDGGWNNGHMGADAAGFLIVHRSCNNIFRRNRARMCGDGFFLAGLTPQYEALGCDDNIFEENDGSYSPNIAFESTFSRGNIFRNNFANRCNYGFWLGFSSDGILEQNNIHFNNQAGIACENGSHFIVNSNSISNNNYGLLLWSKQIKEFERSAPNNKTSHNWLIEDNQFINNNEAIRIAADQDHGIKKLPDSGHLGYAAPQPNNHLIRKNQFLFNVIDIDLNNVQQSNLEDNNFQ